MPMTSDTPTKMNFEHFARTYCERAENTPEDLLLTLQYQKTKFTPTGWVMLECLVMDTSCCGKYTIVPYGPQNTWKTIPDGYVSPRGLASDTSKAVNFLLAEDLPTPRSKCRS